MTVYILFVLKIALQMFNTVLLQCCFASEQPFFNVRNPLLSEYGGGHHFRMIEILKLHVAI